MLCDVLHGAVRADRPDRRDPAVERARRRRPGEPARRRRGRRCAQTAGLGALVVFAGELHAARAVRKVASTVAGGVRLAAARARSARVAEGRVRLARSAAAPAAPLPLPDALDARVPIVPTFLGDDGAGLRAALRDGADAIVFVALGAGHVAPAGAGGAARGRRAVPVALTVRPERGALAARDVRLRGRGGRPARQRRARRPRRCRRRPRGWCCWPALGGGADARRAGGRTRRIERSRSERATRR